MVAKLDGCSRLSRVISLAVQVEGVLDVVLKVLSDSLPDSLLEPGLRDIDE